MSGVFEQFNNRESITKVGDYTKSLVNL